MKSSIAWWLDQVNCTSVLNILNATCRKVVLNFYQNYMDKSPEFKLWRPFHSCEVTLSGFFWIKRTSEKPWTTKTICHTVLYFLYGVFNSSYGATTSYFLYFTSFLLNLKINSSFKIGYSNNDINLFQCEVSSHRSPRQYLEQVV